MAGVEVAPETGWEHMPKKWRGTGRPQTRRLYFVSWLVLLCFTYVHGLENILLGFALTEVGWREAAPAQSSGKDLCSLLILII